MAALSDYLESGILTHLFRSQSFPKPSNISIALTSSIPRDNDTGQTIPELHQTTQLDSITVQTNYSRIDLGDPVGAGDLKWNRAGIDNVTPFAVYSEDISHSGYFYPLFLSESTALANDSNPAGGGTVADPYEFSEFPGVKFYGPHSVAVSGAAANPGYELYEGNGFIKNKVQFVFETALTDWGWVSGVAILDSPDHQSGNLLMFAALNNPRYVYTGDSIKFDLNALEISLK